MESTEVAEVHPVDELVFSVLCLTTITGRPQVGSLIDDLRHIDALPSTGDGCRSFAPSIHGAVANVVFNVLRAQTLSIKKRIITKPQNNHSP